MADHVCDGEPEVSCNKCLVRQEREQVKRLNLQIDELSVCEQCDQKTEGHVQFCAVCWNKLADRMLAAERLISDIASAWKEQKSAVAANVPSGEFREDDLRAEHVSVAKKRLEAALDPILTPEVKRSVPVPKCDHSGIEDSGTGYRCAVCKLQLNGDSL